MSDKRQKRVHSYQKPKIIAVDKGRVTYGCPQSSEKDCGVGYRK